MTCRYCGSSNLSAHERGTRSRIQCHDCARFWDIRRDPSNQSADATHKLHSRLWVASATVLTAALVAMTFLVNNLELGTVSSSVAETPPVAPTRTSGQTMSPSDAEYLAALAVVTHAGYSPHVEHAWGDSNTLHILIGDHSGAPGGRTAKRAFFFIGGRLVGTDSPQDSSSIAVSDHTAVAVTLRYELYAPSDPLGQPSLGVASVRFSWNGQSLTASHPLPPADWSVSGSRRGTPPAATPAIRPIIFIPGIEGSYLTDAAGNETWPNAQGIFNAGCIHLILAYVDGGCESQLFARDAFNAGGK